MLVFEIKASHKGNPCGERERDSIIVSRGQIWCREKIKIYVRTSFKRSNRCMNPSKTFQSTAIYVNVCVCVYVTSMRQMMITDMGELGLSIINENQKLSIS